jgi:hypothetical protein
MTARWVPEVYLAVWCGVSSAALLGSRRVQRSCGTAVVGFA